MARTPITDDASERDIRKMDRNPDRNPDRALIPGSQVSDTEWVGVDGEILTLTHIIADDPYELPEHLKMPGMSYQWIRVSVLGNDSNDMNELSIMLRNGWRPYPPTDDPFFVQDKGKEHVVRGGLMLMCRPEGMTKRVKDEEHKKACNQMQVAISKLIESEQQKINYKSIYEAVPDFSA